MAFGPAPDGTSATYLYISDTGHNRIRYVDGNGIIHNYFSGNSNYCSVQTLALFDCARAGGDIGCQIGWDGAGNAYVTGRFAGTAIGGGSNCALVYGVVRINAADGLNSSADAVVAGHYSGDQTTNGILATAAAFNSPPTIAVDSAGDVFTFDYNASLVRKISVATGNIATIAGTGTTGFSGDYGQSTLAQTNNPYSGIIVNGHLVFAEYTNKSLREIW